MIDQEMDWLQVWDKLNKNIKWSRLYGGSLAFMMIDGQNVLTPLNPNTIGKGQFKGVRVFRSLDGSAYFGRFCDRNGAGLW